jgi:predicted phosphodiesterase
VRTLIISDLHLGATSRSDLLRRPELRAPLLDALRDVDRLILLGDVLELRHGPMREAMAVAEPVFGALGRALAGRELVLVPGNHDHALIEPWMARRGEEPNPGPLEPAHVLDPAQASPGYERLARWAAPAHVSVAYPGMWVRPDVYATHGHYLDAHLTIPTLERLSIGVMSRVLRKPPDELATPDDYESLGAPVFAWRDAVARDQETGAALNGLATVGAWRALASRGGGAGAGRGGRAKGTPRRSLRSALLRRLFVAGFPVGVALLNRAGLGPVRAQISGDELRRAGLDAMGEVAARIGLGDAHVVFGHTHRPGPLPTDTAQEWLGRSGARLVNCGSWTYAGVFLRTSAADSPYWPGVAALVKDSGAPQLLELLGDRTRAELRPGRVTPAPV